jgi:hypothetical protein
MTATEDTVGGVTVDLQMIADTAKTAVGGGGDIIATKTIIARTGAIAMHARAAATSAGVKLN